MRIVLFTLALAGFLGLGDVQAQDSTRSSILSDSTFFPDPVMGHERPRRPALQVAEDEPGSFLLGAIVGAIVAAAINAANEDAENREDGGAIFFLVPISALAGGIIFWTAGIG